MSLKREQIVERQVSSAILKLDDDLLNLLFHDQSWEVLGKTDHLWINDGFTLQQWIVVYKPGNGQPQMWVLQNFGYQGSSEAACAHYQNVCASAAYSKIQPQQDMP